MWLRACAAGRHVTISHTRGSVRANQVHASVRPGPGETVVRRVAAKSADGPSGRPTPAFAFTGRARDTRGLVYRYIAEHDSKANADHVPDRLLQVSDSLLEHPAARLCAEGTPLRRDGGISPSFLQTPSADLSSTHRTGRWVFACR